MASKEKGKSGKRLTPAKVVPASVPSEVQSKVQHAAARVVQGAGTLRMCVGDLAAARSETSELTSEDWEAIQEANIALGQVPRPS